MGEGKFGQIGWRQAPLNHMQAGFAAGRRHSDHSNDFGGHDQSYCEAQTLANTGDTVKSAVGRVRRLASGARDDHGVVEWVAIWTGRLPKRSRGGHHSASAGGRV